MRIAVTSIVVALGIALMSSFVIGVVLTGERDPSCGDSDCDQGVALAMVLGFFSSVVVGALVGIITGIVLVIRRRPAGRRWGPLLAAVGAAGLPLALVVWLFIAVG